MGLSATQPGPPSQSSPKPHHGAVTACSHAWPFPLSPSFKRTGLSRAKCKAMTARTLLHCSSSQSHEPGVCEESDLFLSHPKSEIFHSNCSWFIFPTMRNHPSLARARRSRKSCGCCSHSHPSLPPLWLCKTIISCFWTTLPLPRGCTLVGASPNPYGNWAAWDKMDFSWPKSRKEGGTGCTAGHPPERGSLLVCCLPKSIKKSHKTEIQVGKGCVELVRLTWPPGAWPQPYSIIVSWLPRWDGLHPGSSYPSAPLSSEEWGGWSREWGWSQNQASSRERGHPQGSFIMETTRQMKQRFSDSDGI